ncbi:MAG: AAA family ATPase [Patescibacteria group bacterium]|nr:AAA family ATPase [Patescibacteria group bacterium]MDE1946148.1 AAA family ATPase [Patescibacteria group bacterium]
MYLKSIEIAGFKSFGKKAILDFTTPITGVVGPNGSGKSNVAEAFRFVLGEQSIKSLRGKRAEDLIFNGGKDSPRANRASVKLVFNNAERILSIDFDEVAIERVVNRDSSSEYLINGSPVRLKDIIELLAGAHIGASGHQIISQGEADKILNASIRDRREMIEDALSLKVFQYKKEESIRKLEKTEENTKQVESLRREIAPHIRFLKKQVEKIEKAAEMRTELVSRYHEYFRREEEYLAAEKKSIMAEKSPLAAEREKLERELAQAKLVLAASASKDEKTGEVMAVEGKLKDARAGKDALSRAIGRIEGEISSLVRLVKKQQEASANALQKTVELSSVETMAREIDLEASASAHADTGALKGIIESIRKIVRNFIEKHKAAEAKQELSDLEHEIKRLEEEKKAHEANMADAARAETGLAEEYAFLKSEIEKEKDSNRDAEKTMFRIVAEENDIRGKLSAIDARESRLRHDEEELRREQQEGSIIAGIQALHFKDFWPTHAGGTPLSVDEIANEPRAMQEDRRRAIEKIKIRLEDAGVAGGDDVMKEYKETSERDLFLEKELADLAKSSEALKTLIAELDEKLATEFKTGVAKINGEFQKFFAAMFGGGTASLAVVKEKKRRRSDTELPAGDDSEELAEAEEEGEEGLEIEVSLPRKKIRGLMMLSGGERALTSIALLFAISAVNPPPFIILDETDAALDEANSKKYGDMIAALSEYSQLILITHNRETMSRAGVIYGITMGADGVSRLLSIQFEEAVQVAK